MKTAIVLGSTGLIGSELVPLLEASPHYSSVLLLNRRPSGHASAKVSERIIDFEAPDLVGVTGDDLYCAFGTTRRKAGSEAAQYKVDYEYPALVSELLRGRGVRRMALVSSVGADVKATNFYLRTKGRLERRVIELGFEQTVIARPSFLIGRRTEFRLGEEAAILLGKLLSPFLVGSARKYRGVPASAVARCLVQAMNKDGSGVQFINSDEITTPNSI
jgi:uncharacterized protein YbjT (DUF2867 family)